MQERFFVASFEDKEATWQEMRVASRSWDWPVADSQEENRDLSFTTTRN